MRQKRSKPKIRNDTVRKRKTKKDKEESKPKVNKKVRNAIQSVVDGIKFRSNLEVFTYNLLKENDIPFTYEKTVFGLIPGFQYGTEKIRAATYKPDFVGDGWIIEVKGFETDAFKIRWKLFKYTLASQNLYYDLFLPHNQNQVRECIQKILKNETTTEQN